METIQMTRRQLIRLADIIGAKVYRAGYCELQFYLRSKDARKIAFNSGLYGWNWDAYIVDEGTPHSSIFCTGYRNLVGEARPDLWKRIEQNARTAAGL